MVRKDGKVYDEVAKKLKDLNIEASTLKIVTMGRSTEHMVALHERVIGSYNHRSKQMTIDQTERARE